MIERTTAESDVGRARAVLLQLMRERSGEASQVAIGGEEAS
jgi:hypothetical protein